MPSVPSRLRFVYFAVLFAVLFSATGVFGSSGTATAGQSVTFSVTVNGTAPFTYQWYKDSNPLGSGTNATYTISSVVSGDAGTYYVIVANSAGSTTSDNAVLTVSAGTTAPTISTQPGNRSATAGGSASFTVAASGSSPFTYQWQRSTNSGSTWSSLSNDSTYTGVTTVTLTVGGSTTGMSGDQFRCVVTNSAGSATSNAATLTVSAVVVAPTISTQPGNQPVTAGNNASFTVAAGGTSPFTYQWQRSTNAGSTWSSLSNDSTYAGVATAGLSVGGTTTGMSGDQFRCVVSNSAGSATSSAATLTVTAAVVAPAITTQPGSQAVVAGNSVSFTVVASGTAPLAYQWRKAGVNIIGANSATYTIGTAQTTDATTYAVVVSNSAGSATSNDATLTVTAATLAPSITTQPASVTVTAGTSASFTVVASGTAPLAYQWRKGGVTISGANSATYTIGSAQTSDAADYAVVVSNSAGSVTSGNATLTIVGGVQQPPSNATKLINLSSRTQVGTGSGITIAGFVLAGTQPKTLLIRGIGPALTALGVGGAMQDPTMTIFAGSTVVATNEGWKASNADPIRAAAQRLGAFALPESGQDCAILADFAPGIYTVQLKDKNGGTGVGLIELYDANTGSDSKLINLSTRAFVGRDASILITGLVVSGSTPKTVLVRAVGPGLTAYGVDGVLSHPKMSLFSGQQEIATNTGWTTSANRAAIASVAAQVGAFPLDPAGADSAMLLTLDPGIYTIQVMGANGETGTALVETYAVD